MENKELGIRAVETFPELFKDAWKHDDARGPGNRIGLYCTKCKVEYTRQNDELGKPCTVPTPIALNDWNVAKMLVRECDSLTVRELLMEMWLESKTDGSYWHWLITFATPADYIEAAIKAKEE